MGLGFAPTVIDSFFPYWRLGFRMRTVNQGKWWMVGWIAFSCAAPALGQTVRETAPIQNAEITQGNRNLSDPGMAAPKVEQGRSSVQLLPPQRNLPPDGMAGSPSAVPQDPSIESVPAYPGQTQYDLNASAGYGPERDTLAPVAEGEILTLADVVASLYRSYPVVIQARLQGAAAQGMLTEAYGAYDTKLQGYTLNEPTGFYRNYRQGVSLARQTWWGGYVAAGYRIGRGFFQPWYLERETNKAGEFKLAFAQPLLQGRAIDPQRVAVFQASVDNRAVQPQVQEAILNVAFDAATVYWMWVSAGGKLDAQRELLSLAEARGQQIEDGVRADKYAEVDLVFNQQLIAERRGLTLAAEQKFRESSFKLSLFLRDELGQTIVPNDAWLPRRFPRIDPIDARDFNADLADALARRPETLLLRLELQRLGFDRQLARNDLLPRVDIVAESSQDIGTPTSDKNDKGEFELLIGLQSEVPIQRRKAQGKLQSTSAKMSQVSEKLRLQSDKIAAELQTAYNRLMLATEIVKQQNIAFEAAIDTLDRYRFAFERGKTDLIYLNFLESKANEIEIKLIDAQSIWFSALAELQRALGLDPLEQAMKVTELPPSQLFGPGNMPSGLNTVPDDFDADWQNRMVPRE
ncbi:MAG: TolC family protein [bacterium]|nr:TolC family protein [bacterium]